MTDIFYIIVAIIAIVCYCVIRYTEIPVQFKDIIRIALFSMSMTILVYALIHNNEEYIFGFLASQYIFKSFDTNEDNE